MRLIHTSDWHIGRQLHGVSLLEDQRAVLEAFLELVANERPDAVIIAGDIYDRSVPSKEAVNVLSSVLQQLVLTLKVPTLVIAGNHDSPERLGFLSGLLEPAGLFMEGPVSDTPRVVTLGSGDDAVDVALLPFADPEETRAALGDDAIRGHESALRALAKRALAACHPERKKIAVSHAFVVGGTESESERALVVGGSGAVPADVFEGFDYVALGHLHRPQHIGTATVRYSGSLMKYSFSEVAHDKGVTVVEIGDDGAVTCTHRALKSPRDLRRVEGTLEAVLEAGREDPARDDYIVTRLTDEGVLFNAMARLQEVYPNALHIERIMHDAIVTGGTTTAQVKQQTTLALFQQFFQDMKGAELDDAQRAVVIEAIEAARQDAAEVPA